MSSKRKKSLLTGSILSHLVRLTLPMMIGIVAIFTSNLINAFYVGHLGTVQLASLGFSFPATFAVMSIGLGLGAGTSSVLSRSIGKGETEHIRKITTHSLILTAAVSTTIAIIGILSIDELFGLLGPSPEVLAYIHDYMGIWYAGIGLIMIPMVINSAIRSTGDAIAPALAIGVSAIINAIVDPLLIFGLGPFPRLELQGAAITTVLSWSVSFFLSAWIIIAKKKMLDFKDITFKTLWNNWGKILYIGVPVAMTNLLNPFAISIITGIIALNGTTAVAAYGIGTRIEPIAMVFILALSAALPPIAGQNWGAQHYTRVKETLVNGILLAAAWGAAMYIVLAIFAGPIASSFTKDLHVLGYAKWFLWIVPISYIGQSVVIVTSTILNAINRPLNAALLNGIRIFVFIVPLAYFFSKQGHVVGVFLGITAADSIMGMITLIYALFLGKKISQKSLAQ